MFPSPLGALLVFGYRRKTNSVFCMTKLFDYKGEIKDAEIEFGFESEIFIQCLE